MTFAKMSATKKHFIELEIDTAVPVDQVALLKAIQNVIESRWESEEGLLAVMDVNAYHSGAEQGIYFSRCYCPAQETV